MRATLVASALAIVMAITVGVMIDEGAFLGTALDAWNRWAFGGVAPESSTTTTTTASVDFPANGVFTPEQLKVFDGSDESRPLLLVVLGEVFDVSEGKKFYGKGQGYDIFVGQDSSRSFHSGDWKEPKADVRDLNVMAVADVTGWRTFYRNHQKYKKVGVVVGIYYDENGNPTEALAEVEAKAAKADAIKEGEDRKLQQHPGCDMLHNASTKTTRIACPAAEGDARFPRLVSWTHPGTGQVARRCACISGRELSRGELDIGDITIYPGCQPSDRECTIVQHL
uniref:Cytochrome b5 heme-binding domain-containing protein n=1 Tax=Neobodo designis TaxID=312471 RepID=A0A7S1MSQ7_NEODS|mmetsp:Transcript_46186/g.142415  ORF Transcript_46186/g.142415 Transcript_46186/m.142415 type:complete len:282 (-) Transcript_46186:41-886(-)|eukprot:CAMPEP_0174839048 /NCGR_PEP_ID=MMETSP1114-20130205/7800_1 /TAXON_ID=312471 /ORGANISM="Neobodo designis, Strain CCAP 1951/1" /LENGTH=281 /DNA_ID=CAMNT_0016073169 /DNA_START=41 /DNA_END=886 /DNA_ORIENTATION=+